MERANGTCRCTNGSSNIDVSSDLVAGILRVRVCTRWQSRGISARGKDFDIYLYLTLEVFFKKLTITI